MFKEANATNSRKQFEEQQWARALAQNPTQPEIVRGNV
jgi:hypothetical protein